MKRKQICITLFTNFRSLYQVLCVVGYNFRLSVECRRGAAAQRQPGPAVPQCGRQSPDSEFGPGSHGPGRSSNLKSIWES